MRKNIGKNIRIIRSVIIASMAAGIMAMGQQSYAAEAELISTETDADEITDASNDDKFEMTDDAVVNTEVKSDKITEVTVSKTVTSKTITAKKETVSIAIAPGLTVLDGVDYSAVYDYNWYIAHNPDVKAAFNGDQVKTLQHFINYGMKEGRNSKEDFELISYMKAYPDLRSAFRNDNAKYYIHYMNYGKKEGRVTKGVKELRGATSSYDSIDYSLVYDYKYYTTHNPDVKNALGVYNDFGIMEHFVRYGMKERRQGNDTFDVRSYTNAYQDLRVAFGIEWDKYYLHYIKYGNREGRKTKGVNSIVNPVTVKDGVDYSKVYNYKEYLKNNPDIARTYEGNDIAALDHFVNVGMKHWKKGNDTFDVVSYGKAYRDLRDAFGGNYSAYYLHYIKYGFKEGRTTSGVTKLVNPNVAYNGTDYSKVLDIEYYLNSNQDILNYYGPLDENGIVGHFVRYGAYEGRLGKAEQASYNGCEKTGYLWPTPVSKNITSYFGGRKSPGGIGSTNHKGIDIGSTWKNGQHVEINGTYAVASLPGTVYYVGYDKARGNYVLINHGKGLVTIYQHFKKNILSVGDKVSKGDAVGVVGSTGHSTGPHLHFEVVVNGTPRNPLDYVSPK